jgi:hypothetical protein
MGLAQRTSRVPMSNCSRKGRKGAKIAKEDAEFSIRSCNGLVLT